MNVHPRALVENSQIGEGTRVWQFASVIRGAVIGRNCNIASCAIVDGARIGNNCLIGHGSSLHPGTVLGDDVFVGPSVTFCNDRWPMVSKDGFDIDKLLSGEIITTRIEDGASIGAGAVLTPGSSVGMCAMIAAGAVVTGRVPTGTLLKRSGEMVAIDPARMRNRIRAAG
jgi:acetyltransferase-like isoleucine patch superfamily enzyme